MEITPDVVETQPARRTRLSALPTARILVFAGLILILLAGAYFRFTGLNWDQDQHLHPDERFLTMVLSSFQRPSSISEYFNTGTSRWNPYNTGWDFFVYGTLPIFIIRFVGEELGKTGYGDIYLVGRALSGIFDLATVLLLFFVARRLYDERIALLAAAFSALSVLHIQLSHFMTVDTFATTFTMLCFLGAVLVAQEGKLWQYLLMGLALGMAVASRINLAFLGPLAAVAGGLHLRRILAETEDSKFRSVAIEQVAVRLGLAAVVSLLAFRVFQPYAFNGPGFFDISLNEAWVENMTRIQGFISGEIDYPPSHQWTNRPAYLFPGSHIVLWGLGLPLGIAACAGILLAGWQLIRKRRWQHALPLAWFVIEFGYHGQQFTKNMRYFLPIYPILAMLAAFLLVWLWDRSKGEKGNKEIGEQGKEGEAEKGRFSFSTYSLFPSLPLSPWFSGVLVLVVLAGTSLWAFAFTRIYTRPVSRVTASYWIYDHVPSAATVKYRTDDGQPAETQVNLYLDGSVVGGNGYTLEAGGIPHVTSFVPNSDATLRGVVFNQLTDPAADSDAETMGVDIAADPTGQEVLASAQFTANLEQGAGPTNLAFDAVPLKADQRYYVISRATAGGPIRIEGRDDIGRVTYETDSGTQSQTLRLDYLLETDRTGVVYRQGDSPNVSTFWVDAVGTLTSVTFNYLIDPMGDPDPETLEVSVAADPGGNNTLAQGQITAHMEDTDQPRGQAYTVELSDGAQLKPDVKYYLLSRVVDGGPVQAWSSVLANEHWDDPVPLRVEDRDGFGMYHGFQMQHYNDDSPQKLNDLLEWLDQTDYIMITSNRLYASIPRLPMRYPITTEYYQLLFSGELGFELEKTVTSYPNIGPIQIPDQSAEESFTVYDHPKVWIFRKTDDFSRAHVRDLLAEVAKGPFIHVKPIDVNKSSVTTATTLELPPDRWIRQQQAGTWSAIFNPDNLVNRSTPLTVLVWLLAVEIIGLAVFPIAFVAFSRLADRGYVLSKALGLLLLAWLIWFLSSLTPLPYARWSIGLCLLILAGLSATIVYRRREPITRFIAENRRLLLIGEALFLFAFFTFLLVRLGNPDLWHPARGGEKPMDFAYLNAVIKSRSFPPYDPWFAGGYINYYYFGFVIVGTLIKLVGIVPAKAYNLAVPTLFGLTFVGAFSVVHNLVVELPNIRYPISNTRSRHSILDIRYWVLGILGGLFVTVAGNLEEIQVLLGGLRNAGNSGLQSTIPGLAMLVGALRGLSQMLLNGRSLGIPNDWWLWNASRVMPNGEINEFPYFTFVYADLHAHMIALPITLLALALAVQVIRGAVRPRGLSELGISLDGPPRWFARIDWLEMAQLAVWALIIGSLRATNTWDYPTYLLVAAGALGIREVWRRGRIDLQALWQAGWRLAIVVVLSMVFFWPYIQSYDTAYTSAELWHGERTSLGDYLTIHGFFLFIVGTLLVIEAADWWRQRGRELWSAGNEIALILQYGAVAIGVAVVGLMYLHMWVPALAVILGALALLLALRTDAGPRRRLVGFLFLLGLMLTIAVEFIVLKGDIGRMNTVFKFYIQVWVLWGVASATSLAWLIPRIRRWEATPRQAWSGAFAVLFVAVMLYPLLATPAKIRDRFDTSLGPGLDGTAFMQTAVYHDEGQALQLAYDREAIRWMEENVPGTPVVLEAQTVEYRWGSRIAIYTGLPTVIGWRWHQQQQRSVLPGSVVDQRVEDVRTIFNAPDAQTALDMMKQYDVAYVYVGPLERAYYDPNGLAKFDRMVQSGTLELVYENPAVKVYRVKGQGPTAKLSLLTDPAARRDVHPDLLLNRPVDELPVISDRGWNGLANASPLLSVAAWWLVVTLLGVAAWPLVVVALPRFVDRGSALARIAGLVLVGYLVWIAASLDWLENTPVTAYAMLLLIGLLSFFVLWRRRAEVAAFVRRQWRLVLAEEAIFTAAFLVFVGIRMLNPDLWQPWFGGEKPMEFAFLNAILKSAHFPPYDPYFAGGTINYYYYGLYLVALVIKLTGIVPEVAFNLAVPTLFALTVAAAFSVVYNAVAGEDHPISNIQYRTSAWDTRYWVVGILGVLFVAVIGNLDGVRQLLEQLRTSGNITNFDFWRSSRVIPFTINEFPYFSFLFADLHPHMINIPFSIFVLAMLLHVVKPGEVSKGNWEEPNGMKANLEELEETPEDSGGLPAATKFPFVPSSSPSFPFVTVHFFTLENIFFAVLLVLTLGAVFVINTWELPAYLGLTLAALLLRSRLATGEWRILRNGFAFAVVAGLAYLAYRPFYAHYKAMYVGLGAVEAGSPLKPFLTVWGFFLFVLALYLVIALLQSEGVAWLKAAWRHRARFARVQRLARRLGVAPTWPFWLGLMALVAGVAFGAGLLWIGESVLALLVPLTVAAGVLLLRRQASAGQQFAALLAFVGLGVVAGTELVFLKDFLAGGEWYRMNTVFKFTTEAWVLIALASAMALPTTWRGLRAVPTAHLAWVGAFGVLFVATCVYPVYGTVARVQDRFPGQQPAIGTLNGMAFMRVGEYQWPDDNTVELSYTYDALQWLLANVKGTPVVAEANIGYYREGGLQVPTYTGLPALIGYHQSEQRYDFQVGPRASQADTLFQTTDVREALDIIHELNVSYVYVGQLETAWYPSQGIEKFSEMRDLGLLEVAYQNPKVTIYRVKAPAGAALG